MRTATRADARIIAGFAIALSEQHRDYDKERFFALGNIDGAERFYGDQTESAGARILIAEDGDRPVGFAYIQYEAVNYADLIESAAWLHDLYLEKSARGSGAGRKLVVESIKAAEVLGANKLMLHVAARNQLGQEFFERYGFRTTMLEMMLKIEP